MKTILLLGLFLASAFGCGMSTHNEASQRAAYWYDGKSSEIINSHRNWVQPGSFFPDWGYNCRGFSSESEETHWPPFINMSATYIRTKYQQPWNEDAQNTIAFFFGIMSHSVADNSWHSLSMSEGLIEAMEHTEFRGDWDAAHTKADIGGEFVLKRMKDLSGNAELQWNIPTQDLIELYDNYFSGTDVTENDLETCLLMGYAGIWGNQILGDFAFPFVRNAPLLVEEYEDYFLGGMNDMASWTVRCWEDFDKWLEGGQVRPMCTLMENQWNRKKTGPTIKLPNPELAGEKAVSFLESLGYKLVVSRKNGFSSVQLTREDGKDPMEYHKEQMKKLNEKFIQENPDIHPSVADCIHEDSFSNSTLAFDSQAKFSQFGASLISGDFNDDGIDDLVIGSPVYGTKGNPQTGAVYLVYGSPNKKPSEYLLQDITESSDLILYGSQRSSKFGSALTVVDINRDGVDDLVVSAPFYNSLEMYYDGMVYVYLGSKQGLSSQPYLSIKTDQPFPGVDPNNNHKFKFSLLGKRLRSGDVDGDGALDLIVLSPFAAPHAEGHQRGLVSIFYSSSLHNGLIDIYDADLEFVGENDYERFGSDASFLKLQDGRRILLIGANLHKIDEDTQVVGRLYGYDLSSPSSPYFTLTGDAEYQKFASSVIVGDFTKTNTTFIAVSSTSETNLRDWQSGGIRIIELEGLEGDLELSDIKPYTTIQGGEMGAYFSLSLHSDEDSLWVGEPYYGSLRADEKASTGRIYEWKLGQDFPKGNIRDRVGSASTCVNGKEMRGSFGFEILTLDLNNDSVRDLVVTSLRSSSGSEHSGRVSVFFG